MASQLKVAYKVKDARAEAKKAHFLALGAKGVEEVALVDVYTIDKELKKEELEKIAKVFANSLVEKVSLTPSPKEGEPAYRSGRGWSEVCPKEFSYAIEIGFLPGVTDNVGTTARETIEDLLGKKFKEGEKVYSSRLFFVSGKITRAAAEKLAQSLYNPLIESARVKSFVEFEKDGGMGIVVPKVYLSGSNNVDEVNLFVPDKELEKIGKEGILGKDNVRRGPLGLSLLDLKAIREYFHKQKRNPTDIEIETIAQTWSEHCKHTIFANPLDEIKEGMYKAYIKRATEEVRKKKGKKDFCVSVFKDNSGAIAFNNEFLITHKVETHNSPSILDPFGGAITGIVGVNRDCIGFGIGAKPVANFYGFCFADPRNKTELYRDPQKKEKILSARRIMEGVIAGINAGGNQSGIPTPQGFMLFEDRYRGKPMVFAGTVGLIPRKIGKRLSHVKKAEAGDYIVMLGGKVGLDGVHGATFSSEVMHSGSPATAVQIGDAITQKKLSDAIVKEARAENLYNSITDNGAGGLSSSVGEMAREAGGCEVWLEKVPLKYPGLEPWQIWISESQERMTLSVPKKNWQRFYELMERRGILATAIGQFTSNGRCIVKYGKEKILDMEMEFLHDGQPIKFQETILKKTRHSEPLKKDLEKTKNFSAVIKKLLARPNIASSEFVSTQYDHEVQATSVTKPLHGRGRVNSEASVFRPVLTDKRGVVLSQGLCPTYSDIDAYHMAACSIDTAVRNAVAIGADPNYMALLDNFCWCSSDEKERLGQLKEATRACFDYGTLYEMPYISGKDSMFNDFKGFDEKGKSLKISVPPTLLISSISVIPDISKVVTLDFKFAGDVIYLLGETKEELGASEYFAMLEHVGNTVPKVSGKENLELYKRVFTMIKNDLITSAISLSRGGLAVALLKSAMGGTLGAEVILPEGKEYVHLFSESQGRLLVSVNPKKAKEFEKMMQGMKVLKIGMVGGDNVKILNSKEKEIAKLSVEEALEAYRGTFKNF